ncbi:transposase [Streptomyces fulvoviolaceus]|uniref:transposase n=1 Tax=Streptomyces fulvoviolaceus TaxID=285535 RepID=UPI0021C1D724|nr:transposase [Streptomyces fulvoviolaceus]MCT9082628.1 transposase [Streptomyces fulvoviolaceus]
MSRRVRAGVPWRDLPREYGPWQTVYGLFRRWHRAGIRARFLTLLRARADTTGLITWEANVDSTICRVHRHVAGARGDHGLGRSRGGFTTKIHQPLPPTRRPHPRPPPSLAAADRPEPITSPRPEAGVLGRVPVRRG